MIKENFANNNFGSMLLPREKLAQEGLSSLSNAELLSVIYNSGSKKESVNDLTTRIIQDYNSAILDQTSDFRLLANYLKISKFKAMQLIAILELGRRFFQGSRSGSEVFVYQAAQLAKLFSYLTQEPREQLLAVFLDVQQKFLNSELISLGSLTNISVTPREIILPALRFNTANLILIHNHPSGNTTPSDADIAFTKRIAAALKLVGIKLQDHIIIAKSGFSSLQQLGYFR